MKLTWSVFEQLENALQQHATKVHDGVYIVQETFDGNVDHEDERLTVQVGLIMRMVDDAEFHVFATKEAIQTLVSDLVHQHPLNSFSHLHTFHVIIFATTAVPSRVALALVQRAIDGKKITVHVRKKQLQRLPRAFEKKLLKCIEKPTSLKHWDDLHDPLDEWEELFQLIGKYQHQTLEILKHLYPTRDDEDLLDYIRDLTMQLFVAWHLHEMGLSCVERENERQQNRKHDAISCGGQLQHDPAAHHQAVLESFERLHHQFQGLLTINDDLLTRMKQVVIPDYCYHQSSRDELYKEQSNDQLDVSRLVGDDMGILDLLRLLDWEELKDQFYFFGTIIERNMDPKERKYSGSYYTPPQVAQYIARAAIEQHFMTRIKERFNMTVASVTDVMQEGSEEMKSFLLTLTWNIKILDPAMGSGHFLEAALEHLLALQEQLLEELTLKRVEELIQMELVSIELTEKKDKNVMKALLARHVIQESLYGVDSNPSAVNTCQVRLTLKFLTCLRKWGLASDMMTFVPATVPHLKVGDALVGIHSLDVLDSLMKDQLKTGSTVSTMITKALTRLSDSLRFLQQDFPELSHHYALLSTHDLLDGDSPSVYRQVIKYLGILAQLDGILHDKEQNEHHPLIKQAKVFMNHVRNELRQILTILLENALMVTNLDQLMPFHWIIEYPRLFLKESTTSSSNPGFDVVIGNPPYVRQEDIDARTSFPHYKTLLTSLYSPSNKKYDLSMYFILRGVQLLKEGGWNAYIITDKWLRTMYGKQIRHFLKRNHSLSLIVDVSHLNLFPTARVQCMIYFLQKNTPPLDHQVVRKRPIFRSLGAPSLQLTCLQALLPDEKPWTFLPQPLQELSQLIFNIGTPLKKLRVNIYYGIKTGYNKAFIIPSSVRNALVTKNPRNAELLVPIIMGRCINRYHASWNGQWLILSKDGLDLSLHHPEILEWLKTFESRLKNRTDQGTWWFNLRPCRYYHEFEKPKITWKEIVTRPSFYFDSVGLFTDATAFIMTGSDVTKSLTAVLNSSISWLAIHQLGTRLGPKTSRYKREYTLQLPIVLPHDKNERRVLDILVDAIQFLKALSSSTTVNPHDQRIAFLESLVDSIVFELYLEEYIRPTRDYHPGMLREITTLACESIEMNPETWFQARWKVLVTSDEDSLKQEQARFQELTQINLLRGKKLIQVLERNRDVQHLCKTIQQHEWYARLRRLMP